MAQKKESEKYDLCTVSDRNVMLIREQIGGGFQHVATFRSEYQAKQVLKLLRGEAA